ncbi:response regulator [Cesiribacter andamanensis]|uniref:DNA-binding transcriptional regulator BaeR n=1 Tax=Cesiribacter andamanensis AMV16 TaxID=1279009 RepID=M7NK44_9BACT|nr:response regulator transcription factor [Cesiribacter andamanensis]EMR02150.1 DNA-binding transcriptional regulator BaeR [Cesiribacter andamanensis AMV16]
MQNASILVVEDDPNLGQILQEYLQVKGYQTRLATTGLQGLELFVAGNARSVPAGCDAAPAGWL